MNKKRGCIALAAALCAFGATASNAAPAYTTFTIAGAQTLFAGNVNDSGVVVGVYTTAAQDNRGYLRLADGTLALFDPPGSQLTQPLSLNNNGDVVGYFYDGTTYHGFLRTADGTVTTIDPSGATLSEATAIDDDGTVTGEFEPGSHGYIRTADGNFTIFDAPGAAETIPQAMNDNGDVTGSAYFSDERNPSGFIRTADGTITLFNAPGAISGTIPTGINDEGRVIGWYEPVEFTATGFDRAPDGKIKTFTFPKAVVVFPGNVNDSGAFSGLYYDRSFVHPNAPPHAFFAKSLARIRTFNAPGCKHSFAGAINSTNVVAGSCSDVPLAFIRTP